MSFLDKVSCAILSCLINLNLSLIFLSGSRTLPLSFGDLPHDTCKSLGFVSNLFFLAQIGQSVLN